MSSNIGERIVKLRERRGLSQGQLATYADVEQSYLSMIERGKRTHVGSDIVGRLAAALRTTTDYLLGLTDNPFSSLAASPNLALGELNEARFRNGYVEGWSHAIEAMYILMSNEEKSWKDAYGLCVEHLEKELQLWQRNNLDQMVFPPLLVERLMEQKRAIQCSDPYQEILNIIWDMTPDELKERIIIRLQEAAEEHEQEMTEHETQRETEELIEMDDN